MGIIKITIHYRLSV